MLEAAPPSGPIAACGLCRWPPLTGARSHATTTAGHLLLAAAEHKEDGSAIRSQQRGEAPEPDPDARTEGRGRQLLRPPRLALAELAEATPTVGSSGPCPCATAGGRERERGEGLIRWGR